MSSCKKIKIIAIFSCVVILLGVYFVRVTDTILEVGDVKAEAMLTMAVYNSLSDLTESSKFSYEDFFTFTKNNDNDVVSVITNGLSVSLFTTKIVKDVTIFLDNYSANGVEVPFGVFSGIKLLSGFGKNVRVKLISIASAKCDLVSTFIEAGINQVKHSLYAEVVPDVTLKAVGRTRKVTVKVSVLIYENIIIGKVPDTYLGASIVH